MVEENEKGKKYYKKKIERCKKLGAEKFKKAVFALEKLKFKIFLLLLHLLLQVTT